MRIAVLIARILLGLMFVVFGLNGFLNFLHMPMPGGLAGQFMGAAYMSHYLAFVFLLEVVGGLLLLAGRFLPVGLILLGPILVNVLLFHITMAPAGLPPALFATVLWLIVFSGPRHAFAGIFAEKA